MKILKYLEVFYWVEIIQQNVNVTDIPPNFNWARREMEDENHHWAHFLETNAS